MQFEVTQRQGSDKIEVEFFGITKLSPRSFKILEDYFIRIGGLVINNKGSYCFPSFITSQTIKEIIHNTCFVCGELMKDSTVMIDGNVYSEPDEVGKVSIYSIGEAKQVKVRKCSSCGHSHT